MGARTWKLNAGMGRRAAVAGVMVGAVCVTGAGVVALSGVERVGSVQAGGASRPGDERVSVGLVTELSALLPGRVNIVAVRLVIDEGWHVYWPGQNDTGYAPSLRWTLPEGFEALEPMWPGPERYAQAGGIVDHVYEGELVLIVPVRVPAAAAAGWAVPVSVEAEWLVCKDVCLMGGGSASGVWAVAGEGEAVVSGADAGVIASTRAALPRAWDSATDRDIDVRVADGVLSVRAAGASRVAFFPWSDSVRAADLLAEGEAEGEVLRLRLQASGAAGERVRGVIRIDAAGLEGAGETGIGGARGDERVKARTAGDGEAGEGGARFVWLDVPVSG